MHPAAYQIADTLPTDVSTRGVIGRSDMVQERLSSNTKWHQAVCPEIGRNGPGRIKSPVSSVRGGPQAFISYSGSRIWGWFCPLPVAVIRPGCCQRCCQTRRPPRGRSELCPRRPNSHREIRHAAGFFQFWCFGTLPRLPVRGEVELGGFRAKRALITAD